MTESKISLTSEKENKKTTTKANSNTEALKKNSAPQKDDKKSSVQSPPKSPANTSTPKISKLAIFALLIAIAAPIGHYFWQQQQNQQLIQTLTDKIVNENTTTLNRYTNQTQQALTSQEQNLTKKLQQVAANINSASQTKLSTLNDKVVQLEQSIQARQPSDWLLHEAEYLIRISSRTLWLEHDTVAAIGLLKDADARLNELNDPAFLPVREILRQDINALELMPTLDTDEVVLTLMAMNKQVAQLPLAIVNLGAEDKTTDVNLSDDINDWQTNLAKTWQKFLNDFIRVRQSTGTVEALISPAQQENLKQNLSLKIQLALWSATEHKGEVYQKALIDVQQWLNEYFDMENKFNQNFANALTSLQKKQIDYDYPNDLGSLTAIRTTLRNQQNKVSKSTKADINKSNSEPTNTADKTFKNAVEKTPVQQVEQAKNEGNL